MFLIVNIIFFKADAHAPASLLKLWYRELYDPLIPDELYDECVNTEDPDKAKAIVDRLPELNKLVSREINYSASFYRCNFINIYLFFSGYRF